ncbi:hypothetical protein ACFUCV_02670 [Specibacter sp. NPDC057265]|uniref:hypothetical protein n=1 Tax=Specibacter sp. NPDC057265 TaxID=3346075 RepID=UPI00362EFAC5
MKSSPDPEHHVSRVDARALRFALTFPVLLSVALAVGGLLLTPGLPRGIELPWGGGAVPVPLFLMVAAASMVGAGGGLGALGANTAFPGTTRRVLLGVAMAVQLSLFSLFVAALLGQGAAGELPPQRVSGFVVLMGCGLAAAMGVVLALSFKPEEQWSAADDAALAALAHPEQAAVQGRVGYFLHPRSSVIIMILLAALLPGALLAILSPWILLAMVLAALAGIALLSASVVAENRRITVKMLGFVPVITVPCSQVAAAGALELTVAGNGGRGLRRRRGSVSFLARPGAGVVLRTHDGGRVVLGAPDLEVAEEFAAWVNGRAGETPPQPPGG